MAYYAVTRRYRVEDIVYVEALTAKDAEALVRGGEGEWLAQTSPDALPGRFSVRAERRDGVPRWAWEEMGMPDDVRIAS